MATITNRRLLLFRFRSDVSPAPLPALVSRSHVRRGFPYARKEIPGKSTCIWLALLSLYGMEKETRISL